MLELTLNTHVDLAQSGVRHGAGLFETLRIREGQPLRLDAHLARLSRGAEYLGIEPAPSAKTICAFLKTHALCSSLNSGVLRFLAVDRALMITVSPWKAERPSRILLGMSQRTTRWSGNPLNRFKTMGYLENWLMIQEAQSRGLFEVLALNEGGRLTDGGRTNVFLVKEGHILTPPASHGALPGTIRQTLLESGFAAESPLGLEDLQAAEAVFLTNALQGVVPIHVLEDGSPKDPAHPLVLAAGEILLKA
jgi:branched-chain amino acid aminotransferase